MNDVNTVSEDSKIICSDCGCENTETSKFCVECGHNIQINNNTENICHSCGNISPAGVKFCPECGQNLLDQTVPTASTNSLSDLVRSRRSITQKKRIIS